MVSRRTFLQGVTVALVVPLPVIAAAKVNQDVTFTIQAVEVVNNENDFNKVLRVIADSDEPIRGEIRRTTAAVKYDESIFTVEDMIDELKPQLQYYFNNKLKSSDWL